MADLVYGMVHGKHVDSILLRIEVYLASDWTSVIRSIDSTRNSEGLTYCLSYHGIPNAVVCGNVCVSMADLREAVSRDVFTGFDEVWILPGGPPDCDLSGLQNITSDGTDFSVSVPTEIVEAIARTNCFLAIGDGCGLNFVTTDERLAQEIRNTEKG